VSLRIVIIGAPASGKSTLTGHILRENPGLASFGVRRHFMEQIRLGTEVGLAAKEVVEAGGWIPDELVAKAVRLEFERGVLGDDFVFEGMPGNRRQAELLDELLDDLGLPLSTAIHIDTPEEVCRERASRRMVCEACDGGSHQAVEDPERAGRCAKCGGPITRRPADMPEYLAYRLQLHRKNGPEIVDFYRGPRLIEIDGRMSAAEVLAAANARLAGPAAASVPARSFR
jgi:adenylate kinase